MLSTAPLPDPLLPPLPHVTCPLCGRANRCAVAACGSFDVPCWCTQASFPPALLAQVCSAQRGAACLCAECAARHAPGAQAAGDAQGDARSEAPIDVPHQVRDAAPDTPGHTASQALTIEPESHAG
jgi:hypothetical protein